MGIGQSGARTHLLRTISMGWRQVKKARGRSPWQEKSNARRRGHLKVAATKRNTGRPLRSRALPEDGAVSQEGDTGLGFGILFYSTGISEFTTMGQNRTPRARPLCYVW